MTVLPASIAFSTNSLTTEAGVLQLLRQEFYWIEHRLIRQYV